MTSCEIYVLSFIQMSTKRIACSCSKYSLSILIWLMLHFFTYPQTDLLHISHDFSLFSWKLVKLVIFYYYNKFCEILQKVCKIFFLKMQLMDAEWYLRRLKIIFLRRYRLEFGILHVENLPLHFSIKDCMRIRKIKK